MDIQGQACREIYWEEMTSEQRVTKLAEAVEVLGRSVLELERENALLRQHTHAGEIIVVPLLANAPDVPWYKRHLLGRAPKC